MTSPFRSHTQFELLADWIGERLDLLEARIMALSDSVANVQAVVTDLISDLGVTLTNQQRTLAAMQATVDRLSSEKVVDVATITRPSG
jgi:uncharacterized coiled-coil protein SlyX